MGLPDKYSKTTATAHHESWGLGLFLVFFPNDGEKIKFLDKKKIAPTTNSIFSFTATTILCVALVFFTFCLFTLSNLDDNLSLSSTTPPRRWLVERKTSTSSVAVSSSSLHSSAQFALQGMGTLFRRGTKAMSDLVVAHLDEALAEDDFRVFLRTLHLSGITARADIIFIYNGEEPRKRSRFRLIEQENESFLKLLQNSTSFNTDSFDLSQFRKERRQGKEANLWGRKNRSTNTTDELSNGSSTFNYGSVVGFDVSELDPVDLLSGFIDKLPVRLRRWACYAMLLGRVRRNFKHIMLVDPKDIILLSDSLTKVRHRGAESVHLWRNTDKSRSHKSVTADIIVGGIRGIRWLSNAMLNEIVRASMNRKNKNAISDSGVLSQLVNNDSLLKSLSIATNTEPAIQSANAVVSMKNSSALSGLGMLHRGNSKSVDVNYILRREICLFVLDSFVYTGCHNKNTV